MASLVRGTSIARTKRTKALRKPIHLHQNQSKTVHFSRASNGVKNDVSSSIATTTEFLLGAQRQVAGKHSSNAKRLPPPTEGESLVSYSREPNCTPSQVFADLSKLWPARAELASRDEARCRATGTAGRSQIRIARGDQNTPQQKIGGRLPRELYRCFLHRRPRGKRKRLTSFMFTLCRHSEFGQ